MAVIVTPNYILGNTHQFLLYAKKLAYDPLTFAVVDSVWDLSAAIVTLIFIKPDGSQVIKSAPVLSGPKGIAAYATTTTDLDQVGDWDRYWRIVDGTIDMKDGPITFTVEAVE